jgi:hypothetical protein
MYEFEKGCDTEPLGSISRRQNSHEQKGKKEREGLDSRGKETSRSDRRASDPEAAFTVHRNAKALSSVTLPPEAHVTIPGGEGSKLRNQPTRPAAILLRIDAQFGTFAVILLLSVILHWPW